MVLFFSKIYTFNFHFVLNRRGNSFFSAKSLQNYQILKKLMIILICSDLIFLSILNLVDFYFGMYVRGQYEKVTITCTYVLSV